MRPIDVVRKVCPKVRGSYLDAIEHGDALFKKHGITTPMRLAHFLAQICHESGGLSIEWESGNYSAERLVEIFGVGHHSAAVTREEADRLARHPALIFERVYGLGNPKKARELGNTEHGDGFRYRGGGLMQTTGRANYRRMGQKCGVDFEAHPELVLSADHALKPALAEWTEGNLNAAADRDDIRAITRRINGGLNGLADREAWYRKIRPLIDRVDLVESVPAAVPAPKPKVTAETASAGTIATGGVIAAAEAKRQGATDYTAALICGGLVLLAIVAFVVIKKFKKG